MLYNAKRIRTISIILHKIYIFIIEKGKEYTVTKYVDIKNTVNKCKKMI